MRQTDTRMEQTGTRMEHNDTILLHYDTTLQQTDTRLEQSDTILWQDDTILRKNDTLLDATKHSRAQTSPDCSGNPLRSKDCNGKRDYRLLQGVNPSLLRISGYLPLL